MSNKNGKERKTPKLRFPGFTGEWEERKLGEMGITYTGLSGKTREDFGHGDGRFVTYMNVFLNPISDLTKTETIEIDKAQNNVRYGDVFFTASSETPEEVGMSSVWLGNIENIYLNSFCFGYRPTVEIFPYYMAYMLRSEAVRRKIIYLAQGISRYNISKKSVMEIKVPIPDLTEQKKIGEYFRKVDHLIILQQNKMEHVKKLKKGLLQKMFPRKGEDMPELRIPGFSDAWEQRKLGEVAEKVYGGGTPKTSEEEFWGGNIPWFQSADLHEHEVQLAIPKKAITTLGLQKSAAQLVPGNSIAIVTRVGVGKLVFMPFSYATSQDFLSLSELNIDGKFGCYAIYRLLQREKNLTQGTSIKGITKDEILQKKIVVPNKIEQKKIGDYFTRLDHLITLHQRKLDHLKQLKKGLLQQMFIM